MPYILRKTNGNTLVTVNDATVDNSTSLTFVGRNYSGYGDYIDQNFLYLLESSANTTAPSSPLQGQLWFNNSLDTRRLTVCYDGINFKGLAYITVSPTEPTFSSEGDLWWDSSSTIKQLKSYSNGSYVVIGPSESAGNEARWLYLKEPEKSDGLTFPILEASFNNNTVVVLSDDTFVPLTLSTNFPVVKAGITLPGADPITGSSQQTGNAKEYLLWGTAADAKVATTATNVRVSSTSTGQFYLPLIGTTSGSGPLYTTSTFTYQNGVLNATATSARYADLAERYHADTIYEEGTVLVVGGEFEVTTTGEFGHHAVAGIVSRNPAYMMNSDVGNDDTHPYIALKGRVKCKVVGCVQKGDRLVTSRHPGYAARYTDECEQAAIVGIAMESNDSGFGIIEVKV
jgi:hypothetical protein